jgi:3-hydroxyisobutyrate dehydrogenase and related beta-hydroxyacid dehydrogenases
MTRGFRKNVGVIGLGIIGRRVAKHLRRQGLAVFVWNRTPRPVPNFVGSPAELTETCNYLQIFVADDEALMRIIQLISPSLTSSHIVIAHPTVAPETMCDAASLLQRRGARLIEAPFTGSKLAAEQGQLVYYVSGDEAAVNEVRPLLEASSKAIVNIGAIGQANIIKLATNMVTAANVQAAAEAMALVHYSGIALEKFAEAMKHNASNSGTLELKIPRIMAGDFEPHFSVKHMLKDMQIANRLGRGFDLDLTVAGATRDRLLDEARQGRGDEDYSSIARRFLPFVEEGREDLQPDLFSQPVPAEEQPAMHPVPHEEPEFVEQQLAEIEATYAAEAPAPPAAEQTEEFLRPEPEPAVGEAINYIPIATEIAEPQHLSTPQSETESQIVSPPAAAIEADEEDEAHEAHEAEEPQGFFRRLLRRSTDY